MYYLNEYGSILFRSYCFDFYNSNISFINEIHTQPPTPLSQNMLNYRKD